MVAGLLGIILGFCGFGFGVHNFYLGYTGKAVAQLCIWVVGLLTSWLVVGVFLMLGSGIWCLIEGIMILAGNTKTDAKGNLLE